MTARDPMVALEKGKKLAAKKRFRKTVAGIEVRVQGSVSLERAIKDKRDKSKKQGGSWCYIKNRGRPSKELQRQRQLLRDQCDTESDNFL